MTVKADENDPIALVKLDRRKETWIDLRVIGGVQLLGDTLVMPFSEESGRS